MLMFKTLSRRKRYILEGKEVTLEALRVEASWRMYDYDWDELKKGRLIGVNVKDENGEKLFFGIDTTGIWDTLPCGTMEERERAFSNAITDKFFRTGAKKCPVPRSEDKMKFKDLYQLTVAPERQYTK